MKFFAKVKKESGAYIVSFPDLPNVNTYGDTLEEALKNAAEALNGALLADFGRGFELPRPRQYKGRSYHPITVVPHIAVAYQLRQLRNGESQGRIARNLGVSYQVIQKLENPRTSNPSLKTLEKLAQVFGKRIEVAFV
jgi:antitoxin HicB